MSAMRPLTDTDHAAVLALNQAHVELLSPLDGDRLRQLLGWADQACAITLPEDPTGFAGFVLTFAAGSGYDGDHFGWFERRYPDCYYLDRVVLAPHARRRGLATQVYDELEARAGRPELCLEVNVDPPNEPSLAFHRGRGYVEVGRRGEPGHVSAMLVKELPAGSA